MWRGPGRVRLAPDDHALVVAAHHIACDGWSVGVLVRDLAGRVPGPGGGGRAAPAGPGRAVRGLRRVAAGVGGRGPAGTAPSWGTGGGRPGRGPGRGPPAGRPAPTGRPVRPRRGGVPARVGTAAACRVRDRGRAGRGVLPFPVLLAAFAALLGRYAGTPDVVVGVPVAGRGRPELDDVVGLFVNLQPVRLDLAADPTFDALVARASRDAVVVDAHAHQDLPFEQLVEHLRPERHPARHPLFNVAFGFAPALPSEVDFAGLTATPIPVDTGASAFDLSLSLTETGDGFAVRMEYAADLFDPATAERMLAHYLTLLEGAIADPGCRLSRLPLLTPTEQLRLAEWGFNRSDYPEERCLHELVAEQAERTPDAVAVVGEGELTYRELVQRANRLAHRLRAVGVGPETLVRVCLDRTAGMVVGLLGVLAWLAEPTCRWTTGTPESGFSSCSTTPECRCF